MAFHFLRLKSLAPPRVGYPGKSGSNQEIVKLT
jgi:hypothetical protein